MHGSPFPAERGKHTSRVLFQLALCVQPLQRPDLDLHRQPHDHATTTHLLHQSLCRRMWVAALPKIAFQNLQVANIGFTVCSSHHCCVISSGNTFATPITVSPDVDGSPAEDDLPDFTGSQH
jgi:hypothetical protein